MDKNGANGRLSVMTTLSPSTRMASAASLKSTTISPWSLRVEETPKIGSNNRLDGPPDTSDKMNRSSE